MGAHYIVPDAREGNASKEQRHHRCAAFVSHCVIASRSAPTSLKCCSVTFRGGLYPLNIHYIFTVTIASQALPGRSERAADPRTAIVSSFFRHSQQLGHARPTPSDSASARLRLPAIVPLQGPRGRPWRGIERSLGMALELRHHFTCDQFVACGFAQLCASRRYAPNPALGLLPQPLDLRRARFRRADGAKTGAVDELEKAIEFEKGKTAIGVPSLDKLPAVIDTLITAVRNGELEQFGEASTHAYPRKSKRAA
jgi:hypothetical protein